MSELRHDPLSDRWVVIAPERAQRPMTVHDRSSEFSTEDDPFAEGNEWQTTREVMAFRHPDSPPNGAGWRVRVITNKYPAFRTTDGFPRPLQSGVYSSMEAIGAHEVIIECPHYETELGRLPLDQMREVFHAYRDRILCHKRDQRLVHATIFKNKGAMAGASLGHSHSQLVVTPFTPPAIHVESSRSLAYLQANGRSLFEAVVERELAESLRLVVNSTHVLAFCPYASRFPYEICIIPKEQYSHYETTPQAIIDDTAFVMKTLLQQLAAVLPDPPYNFILHTAPFLPENPPQFRWHIELFPRTTRAAGFEWGTGCFVNEVPPEDAARKLRSAIVNSLARE